MGDSDYRWAKQIGVKVMAPGRFKLMPNYPNPFNPTTTIRYQLPAKMDVQVTIYNVLGRRVATLANATQKAGQHELRWDASQMASGLYFYRVVAKGGGSKKIVKQKKMTLIK